MSIDWFAVECVLNGTKMPLSLDERRAVIRRMGSRPTAQIAELIGMTQRNVTRTQEKLKPATEITCPVCHQIAWVVDGEVEPHADRYAQECVADEDEWAELAARLASRLQRGDRSVWLELERMGETHLRVVLLAALAGFSESNLAWLQEAV